MSRTIRKEGAGEGVPLSSDTSVAFLPLSLSLSLSDESLVHVAAVKVPAVHELVPETVYPESHVGWQVDPLAKELVHVPTVPLVGAVDASQKGANTRT